MSGAPTSEPDGGEPEILARAGWTNAELIWEQIQEAAACAWAAGDHDDATELWRGALDVADRYFIADDPRRATSRINIAVARRGAGDGERARRLLDEALMIWAAGAAWVERLQPERLSRSSLFHLRLEAKHRGGYEPLARARYRELYARGQNTIAVLHGSTAVAVNLESWQRARPAGFTDARKLLGAVLLMVTEARS